MRFLQKLTSAITLTFDLCSSNWRLARNQVMVSNKKRGKALLPPMNSLYALGTRQASAVAADLDRLRAGDASASLLGMPARRPPRRRAHAALQARSLPPSPALPRIPIRKVPAKVPLTVTFSFWSRLPLHSFERSRAFPLFVYSFRRSLFVICRLGSEFLLTGLASISYP